MDLRLVGDGLGAARQHVDRLDRSERREQEVGLGAPGHGNDRPMRGVDGARTVPALELDLHERRPRFRERRIPLERFAVARFRFGEIVLRSRDRSEPHRGARMPRFQLECLSVARLGVHRRGVAEGDGFWTFGGLFYLLLGWLVGWFGVWEKVRLRPGGMAQALVVVVVLGFFTSLYK